MKGTVRSSMVIDRFGGRTLPRLRIPTNSGTESRSRHNRPHYSDNVEVLLRTPLKWTLALVQPLPLCPIRSNGPPGANSVVNCENDIPENFGREETEEEEHEQSGQCGGVEVKKSRNGRGLKRKLCKLVNFWSCDTPSKKTQGMLHLGSASQMATLSPCDPTAPTSDDRSRSMEFLDDSNRPPENTLMKRQENRQLSEHELRVQRSLQKLDVPDWYKKHAPSSSTSTTKNFGSGSGLAGGWSGLSTSKTNSLSSLQSAGRYSGSRTHFGATRLRNTGTASAGGRLSRESLMSPSSTASASPSPYFERSSFTYGMPYALTRFASARMGCGASPASLSPSPSPVGGVGSSTTTPVSSGPMSRHHFTKQPYLGWRSQERLASKSLYRTPAERMAADILAQKPKPVTTAHERPEITIDASPRQDTGASDLSLSSLNNSEESNSQKINRVRSSIKAVSNAIVDYVNESRPLDDGTNGGTSPRRGLVWLESSFVGTKPMDSPGTPDTPTVIASSNRAARGPTFDFGGHGQSLQPVAKKNSFKFDAYDHGVTTETVVQPDKTSDHSYTTSYLSRNEQMEERSNSSSVSSPTLEDILDSLLALRRPNKKIRSREKGHHGSSTSTTEPELPPPPLKKPSPVTDWHERMNQPVTDSTFYSEDAFVLVNKVQEPESSVISSVEVDSVHPDLTSTVDTCPGLAFKTEPEEMDVQAMADVDSEENAFGDVTDIPAPSVLNSGLNESNPPTPRHRRVSFDLDTSDKEEKSSSRSRRDESVGGTIHCRNSKCGKSASGLEARREFKTCHNCNAYYCTRECRRAHWEKHKKVCMQSRVGALCKQIINHVKEDSFVVSQLSGVARRGYLAKGRGCVKLFFSSPDRAERFLTGGLPELPEPWYIPHGDMLPEEMGAQTFQELSDQCRTYNTETRFVLYASVCVVNEVPTSGAVKWEREMISRSSKLRLLLPRSFDENQFHHHAATTAHLLPEDTSASNSNIPFFDAASVSSVQDENRCPDPVPTENDTLILRSVPAPPSQKLSSSDHKRLREVSFANIQKHLVQRGVDLRRTYPDIYSKLCNYVENDEPFMPVTIYPKNSQTGRQFVCVIMPETSDTDLSHAPQYDPSHNVETIDISKPAYDDD